MRTTRSHTICFRFPERSAIINALFRDRNGGPIDYEEGYSTTGIFLACAMVLTGCFLALRAALHRDAPSPTVAHEGRGHPQRKEEAQEKKDQ